MENGEESNLKDETIISQFAAIVVFDLETNTLPDYNGGRVSITEICMYGVLNDHIQSMQNAKESNGNGTTIPQMPRVMQKLTLAVNPRAPISLIAEKLSGLDNYLLEHCVTFNENTAIMIENFIKQLSTKQGPVCLVAHNGYNFDFKILKMALTKFDVELPIETMCVDSMHAFYVIDGNGPTVVNEKQTSEKTQQKNTNWQQLNETTPKRSRISPEVNIPIKYANNSNEHTPDEPSSSTSARKLPFASRKNLFPDAFEIIPNSAAINRMREKYFIKTPRGTYQLAKIYERIFGTLPDIAHFAEADVNSLMKLILHYGNDFLNYAQTWAVPFSAIKCDFKITN